jgi:sarcosine oxidase
MRYDVVILGLGGMGSAAIAHLARRGVRVAGFEQFELVHDLGSSTGRTRIIRKAYFEDAAYVPLLERAYVLWRELEEASETSLLDLLGVLMLGPPGGEALRGVAYASEKYGVPIERFDTGELRARYPRFAVRDGEIGYLEPEAGVVFPERAIAAHLRVARAHGADLYEHARVARYDAIPSGVRVTFTDGETVEAAKLAVCAGAWSSAILERLQLPLVVQRNVQYWFTPPEGTMGPSDVPAFLVERGDGPQIYGMPDLGDGFKVAFHRFGDPADPNHLDREVHPEELARIESALRELVPGLTMTPRGTKVCMYTMTPDLNFAIGRDPQDANVVIAAGFSGHGFKFAPVIGEIVAQLCCDEEPPFDLAFLRPNRLLARPQP